MERLKMLSGYVTAQQFADGVLISDSQHNKNGIEHGISENKLECIKFCFTFEGIKKAYTSDDDLIWRCVYWLNEKGYMSYYQSISKYFIKELNLTEVRLNKLKKYKCQKSDNEQFKYSEKAISDETSANLLKMRNEM